MDIAALSVAATQNRVQNQAELLVYKKVLETMQQDGQAMAELLTSAGPALPHLGQTVDIQA